MGAAGGSSLSAAIYVATAVAVTVTSVCFWDTCSASVLQQLCKCVGESGIPQPWQRLHSPGARLGSSGQEGGAWTRQLKEAATCDVI